MVEKVCRFIFIGAEQEEVFIYLKRVRSTIFGESGELVSVSNAPTKGSDGSPSGYNGGGKNASPFSSGRVDHRTRCNKGDRHGCLPTVELTGNGENSKEIIRIAKTC